MGGTDQADQVRPGPQLGDAMVRLDEAFRRIRRWMSNPPSSSAVVDLSRVLGDAGDEPGVDPAKVAACEAVMTLRAEGGVSVKAVATYLSLEQSTTSRLVGECQRLGLLHRDPDPEDRRRVLVTVTERGEELAEHTARVRRRVLASLVSDWDEVALEEFLARFEQLSDRIGRVVGEVVSGGVPPELLAALESERADADPDAPGQDGSSSVTV